MAVQSSRRAFLSGRRSDPDPWLLFLSKLRARQQGVVSLDRQFYESRAHWVPTTFDDIDAARILCQQFGVTLCLQGLEATADSKRSTLVVEPGRAWARPIPLDPAQGLWRFDAACTMQVLQAAGVAAAKGADPNLSLALWFAMGTHQVVAPGGLSVLGIHNIEMMFVDGTIEAIGAFGENQIEPLRSIFMQRNIPQLFDVARQTNLPLCVPTLSPSVAVAQNWPEGCFRVDALNDLDGVEPHLGQFFVGHKGRLGWLVAVTFRGVDTPADHQKDIAKYDGNASDYANLSALSEDNKKEVKRLNHSIKNIFDSHGVFLP